MDENQNQVIIGIRGEAKQALATAIILIPLALLIGVMFGFMIPYLLSQGDFTKFFDSPNPFFIGFAIAFFSFGAFSIPTNFIHVFRNNKMLPKPVLVYDKEKDVFIGYSIKRNNQQVIIRNGKVLGMTGSAMWNARELIIRFIDIDGKTRRESFGFARNIDNGVLRAEFNKYSKNKI